MALEIGSIAPDFLGSVDFDKSIRLSDYVGKWVVLYFYPKDHTSGCTKEACSFRDNMEDLTQLGAIVIGVSPDTIKSHQSFRSKYNLNFTLVADPEKEICKLYDVIGEKSMYGKKYFGVKRTTYIIDPTGHVRWVNPNVKVDGHVEEVKKHLTKLQAEK
ncbi:MAG: peroxiredoxin [Candidatus Kapaibacteriales bacterium]